MTRALAALLGLSLACPLHASQPQFWRVEGAREFLSGENEGLVVDSDGHLRLAPATRLLQDTEAPYVWCLTVDDKGRAYLGTGNDGKVFVVEKGQARLLFDAPELEVHALALGRDDKLYVGTAPDGKVYRVDAEGKSEVFFDPSEKYVWALAFDSQNRLFVATGAEAKLYRVDQKGSGVSVLSSPEGHLTALAVDGHDNVYVGTAPGGIVYRVDAELRTFALVDSPYREVKALAVGAGEVVYAAVLEAARDLTSATTSPPPAPTPPPTAEVTVSESFAVPMLAMVSATPPSGALKATGKGAVLRLSGGDVETLWSSADDAPHALLVTEDGLLVGSGDKGRLYRIRDDRSWAMEGTLAGEQLTALARAKGGELLIATSNPGRLHERDQFPGTEGTFTSPVKDTEAVSTLGIVRFEGQAGAGLEVQTRSGNTSAPDSTWSDWSAAYTRATGQPVTSPKARFVQLRARLKGRKDGQPLLDGISLAYLQRNLSPQVASVNVHPAGEVFQKPLSVTGEIEILGMEAPDAPDPRTAQARAAQPAATSFSRKLYQRGLQTLSWKADDPNNDTLLYDLYYRLAGETRYRLLRRGVNDMVFAWDTMALPNGRYVVKVVARDTPSNPEALAQSGEKESLPFEVDNTPPTVTAQLTSRDPVRIGVRAKDEGSLLRRAEFSIDGQRWQEVHPQDGINDDAEESYQIVPGAQASAGPHVLVVRVTDLLGNAASTRVEFP